MSFSSMESVLMRLSSALVRKPARDDDFVDRLHYRISVIMLVAFAIGTALQEYVGEPINCWTPPSFPQEHYTEHVNGYCWTHPLRYPESSHEVGLSGAEVNELLNQRRLFNVGTAFYRWVSLIFILQAVLFKVPSIVWHYLNRQSGASLTKMRDLLTEAQANSEQRHSKMDEAAQYLHSWLAQYRAPSPRKMFGRDIGRLACLFQGCGRRSGKYLCIVYLCTKVLYLVNVAGNFLLLSAFLDAEFWRYGLTVLSDILFKGDWTDPVNFPRLLICDFRLHEGVVKSADDTASAAAVNDSKVHTVQCVLSINMILEKLFVLEWFWLVVLGILTIVTFVTWSAQTVCPCAPYIFARTYMKSAMYKRGEGGPKSDRSGERFVSGYLREDGMFVIRMVEANTGTMMVKELVQHLWDNFQARNSAINLEIALEENNVDVTTVTQDENASTDDSVTEDKDEDIVSGMELTPIKADADRGETTTDPDDNEAKIDDDDDHNETSNDKNAIV